MTKSRYVCTMEAGEQIKRKKNHKRNAFVKRARTHTNNLINFVRDRIGIVELICIYFYFFAH